MLLFKSIGWLSSCLSCCRWSTCMDFQFHYLSPMVNTEIGSNGDCGPSTSYYLPQYMVPFYLCTTQIGERDYLVCYYFDWHFLQVCYVSTVICYVLQPFYKYFILFQFMLASLILFYVWFHVTWSLIFFS